MTYRLQTCALLAALMLSTLGGVAHAASEGRLIGSVTDEAGVPLKGVRIILIAAETNQQQAAKSTKKGEFKMIVLNAARGYQIVLEKEGYQTIQEPIKLQIGGAVRNSWTMVKGEDAPAGEGLGAVSEAIKGSAKAGRLYQDGLEAYNADDMATAIAKFQEIVELDPGLPDPYLGLSLSFFKAGQMEQCIATAEQLLELRPGDAPALRVIYEANASLGDSEGEAAALAALVEFAPGPETARSLFNAGVVHVKAGELEDAYTVFDQVRQMDPELGPNFSALARVTFDLEKYDESLEYAKEAHERMPGNADILGLEYLIYAMRGQAEEAGEVFEVLKGISPEYVGRGFFEQGVNFFNEGSVPAATAIFERVLSTLPDHPRAHYMMGLAQMSQGNFEEAKRLLGRFIELAPDDPEVGTAREMLSAL